MAERCGERTERCGERSLRRIESGYNEWVRIGVNLLPFRRQLAGAGRYAQNLLRELIAADARNQYLLFVTSEAASHFDYGLPNAHPILATLPASSWARIAYEQCVLPVRLISAEIDVLLTASVAVPVVDAHKRVTVIYDMIAEQNVGKYPPLRSAYVREMSRYAARASDAVITISENSRTEIARYAHIPAAKIFLAPPAAENVQRVFDASVLTRVRQTYRLPPRFILYLGTLEPGKNLGRLARAFARMKNRMPELPQHLVLAGAAGWGMEELERELARLARQDIHRIGYVDEQDLAALYSLADVFVYPSLYEGFGIPPLEAMACGTPVIVSNRAALPEVVGSAWAGPLQAAGILAPPDDEAAWADAMTRVLTDRALRERLRAGGLQRARQFRWETSAQVVRAVIAGLDE